MSMFDWFLLPDQPDVEFQSKDFACDLDWLTLSADRRLCYLQPDRGDHVSSRQENGDLNQYSGTIELIGGGTAEKSYGDYILCVARVRDGYVGRFFPSFGAMKEYDDSRSLYNRRGQRKRHRPKKREPYVSKADRILIQQAGLRRLRELMSNEMYRVVNTRKGFMRRLLDADYQT